MSEPHQPEPNQPGSGWTKPEPGQWNPAPQPPAWQPPPAPSAGPASAPPPGPSSWTPAPPVNPAFGATAPPGYYFDPTSGVALPDGTVLAPVGRRIGQYFMDLLLVIVTLVIGYIVWMLIVWGRGQTPGMQVLHMRCFRTQDGRVAHWGWMCLRQVIGGFVEGLFFGIVFLVSSIMMITSRDRRAIHDHIAGTIVLHDPNEVLRTP